MLMNSACFATSLGYVIVNTGRSVKLFVAACIEDEQIAHDDVACHLDKATGHEVKIFRILCRCNFLNCGGIYVGKLNKLVLQRQISFGNVLVLISAYLVQIGACGHVAYGCHNLGAV